MLFGEGQVWIPGPPVLGFFLAPPRLANLESPLALPDSCLRPFNGDGPLCSACPFPQGGQEAPERQGCVNMHEGAFVTCVCWERMRVRGDDVSEGPLPSLRQR